MAKNYLKRYVWLIDTIKRHGHITFSHLSNLWEGCGLNNNIRDERKLPERTFHNHIIAIEDIFGIKIKCDRSLGYYIANSEDMEADGIRNWLLESLSMSNMLNEAKDMRNRILFEKVPSSQRWLPVIVDAMRDKKAVEITYQSFGKENPSTFIAHPYCLKYFKQCWYVLARGDEMKEPWMYALDSRMKDVKETRKALKVPSRFNAESFFADYFGVIVGADWAVQEVKIAVDADQVQYFENLPLHPSQKKVDKESTERVTVYKYKIAPTYDFKQEIMRHGADIEVLAPESLRQEIAENVAAMAKKYGI
jgi:DUF2075 family protein